MTQGSFGREEIRRVLSLVGWAAAPLVGAGIPSAIDPIVIGGCGSSGTTLLRQMLDRHPQVFCGPESDLFLNRTASTEDLAGRFGFGVEEVRRWREESRTKVEFIERFQAACLARSGKSVWAEKTPENIREFANIARRFPRARLVHVIRDGRDVACSLLDADWMRLEKITGGADRNSPEALESAIRYWAERVAFGRRLAGSPNYHEVRYEDLLADPETSMRNLLAFAGLAWDARVLQADAGAATRDGRPIYHASVGRWRDELSGAEADIVDREAGGLLAQLGYAPDSSWTAAQPRTTLSSRARPQRPAAPGLKGRLKALRRDGVALGLMLKDRAGPAGPRLLAALVALYVLAPIDLIPDRRPFGYLDDATLAMLALPLMIRLAPAAVMRRHRIAAARFLSRRIWQVAPRRPLATGLGLREALARTWTRLLGAVSPAGYVVDAELRFVTVSPGALRTWGKAPADVLGKRMLEVFPGNPGESYRAHLEALRTSRAMRLKTISRVFNRPMEVAIRPISGGLRVQFALAA